MTMDPFKTILAMTFALVVVPVQARSLDTSAALLVAEKAVIVASAEGSEDELEEYLVIWNGTTSGAVVKKVEGDAFSRIRLVQTSFDREGNGVTKNERSSLSIPPHAKLVMLQRGAHLHVTPTRPLSPGEEFTLELTFTDGTSRTLAGTVEKGQEGNDIHHHDPSRPEWIRALNETASQGESG